MVFPGQNWHYHKLECGTTSSLSDLVGPDLDGLCCLGRGHRFVGLMANTRGTTTSGMIPCIRAPFKGPVLRQSETCPSMLCGLWLTASSSLLLARSFLPFGSCRPALESSLQSRAPTPRAATALFVSVLLCFSSLLIALDVSLAWATTCPGH